jgi:hypothetical protein
MNQTNKIKERKENYRTIFSGFTEAVFLDQNPDFLQARISIKNQTETQDTALDG